MIKPMMRLPATDQCPQQALLCQNRNDAQGGEDEDGVGEGTECEKTPPMVCCRTGDHQVVS